MTIGLKTLIAHTNESARALQYWSDLGIIRAEPTTDKKGRGRHREYQVDELNFALIAAQLNKLRIPLGDVRAIVGRFRDNPSVIKKALSQQDAGYIVISPSDDDGFLITNSLGEIHDLSAAYVINLKSTLSTKT